MINFKAGIIILTALLGLVVGWQNVALIHNGSTCTASNSSQGHPCGNAFDGFLWSTRCWLPMPGDGVGIWIQVTFGHVHVLTYGRVMQRFRKREQNFKIELLFDGGRSVEEYLVMRTAHQASSYVGQAWDEFPLDGIRTSSVRITVIEVYSTYLNGFTELEFYTGINPCQTHYTFLRGSCYRFSAHRHIAWTDARHVCQQEGGDLAHIGSEAERWTVLQWLEKGFDFDADLWVSNSEITLSSPTVEEGQVGNVSLHKPGGGLAYKSDDIYPLFICEAPSSSTEGGQESSNDDSETPGHDVDLDGGSTGSQTSTANVDKSCTTMVGVLSFCAIIIVCLLAVITCGCYRFHKMNRNSCPHQLEYMNRVFQPDHIYSYPGGP